MHSVAAALMLKPEEIHYFSDIGYRVRASLRQASFRYLTLVPNSVRQHEPFQHCPVTALQNQCTCSVKTEENFEFHGYSCTPRWKVRESEPHAGAMKPAHDFVLTLAATGSDRIQSVDALQSGSISDRT